MAVKTKKTFPNAVGANGQSSTVFTPVEVQLNNQDDLDVYVTLSGGTRVLQNRNALTNETAQSSHPQVNNTDGLYFPAVTAGTTLYNYSLSTDNNTITFNSALPNGAVVSIERRTRDADSSYTTFASGSTIRATDLNNSSTESNFTAQEARNKAFELEGKIFGGEATGTSFITSDEIVDGSIVNADINNNAEIAVSKLANGSARQLLQTATNGTDVEFTSNVDIPGTLDVTGNATLDSNLTVTGTADLNGDLDVDGSTNLDNTTIDGYINVNGVATVDNVQINGNEVRATSGGLELDSQTGTVTVDDNLTVTGNLTYNGTFNNLTPTEIAILDGATLSTAELNLNKDQTATAAEVNILDGATLNTTELNKLDGFTGTAADLNEVVTGKNVVETISNTATDTQIPTAQAVNERITAIVSDVGGFVPIANETSFPTFNPDLDDSAGTIVSIKALSSSFTTGSGVTTHTFINGAGSGNNVTITGLTANTTYPAGRGMLLETTLTSGNGSANPPRAYAFHRLTLDEAGVANAQAVVDDFNERYYGPLGSEPSTRPGGGARVQGDIYFSTADNQMKVWNNAASQWDNVASAANSNIVTLTPAFNSSETEFTCSTVPVDAQSLLLSINGVIQKPNSGTSTPSEGFVKLANGKIKLATAPPTGSSYFAVSLGNTVSIGTPSDNTVTSAKIVDGSIVNADISSSAAIAKSKLETFVSNNANNRVITGSNTANTLDGNPNLIFNGTNLGVGTSPYGISDYSTLHLYGAASGAGAGIRLQDNGDTADSNDFTIYKNSAAGYLRVNGTDPIKFYMNGADRLEVTSTGDLNVSGISTGSTSTASEMARLNLGSSHSSSVNGECKIKVWADSTDQMGFGISNNQLNYITTATNYDHVFYGGAAGTSELFRIQGNSDYIDIADNAVLTFNSQSGQIDSDSSSNFRFKKVSGNGYIHISNNNGHVYVDASNTGTIYLRSGNNNSGVNNAIVCNPNGQVDIYHAGNAKLITTSQGIKIEHGNGGSGGVTNLPRISTGTSHSSTAGTESKILLWEGSSGAQMGFGISNNQLDYITRSESGTKYDHVFYGGSGGDVELLKIPGNQSGIDISAQNLKFDNGYGIDFSSVTTSGSGTGVSVSGSVLDDYEEGTWTPVMTANGGTQGWSYGASGAYTKIGNVVHARFSFQSYTGNLSGSINLEGLPFTNNFRQYVGDFGFYKFTLITDAVGAFIYVPAGTTAYPYWTKTGGHSGTGIQGSDMNSGAYFEGTISYRVA